MLFFLIIFAIMINRVRNTVLSILNKENQGYLTPFQFNLYAKNAQTEVFIEHFRDYSRAIARRNKGNHKSGLGDIPRRIAEIVDQFTFFTPLSYVVSSQSFTVPSDMYKVSSIYIDITNVEVEPIAHSKVTYLLRSLDTAPSASYPVYTMGLDGFKVYPTTVTSGVLINYIRYPKDPNWTYTGLSGGEPIFNQSANDYQDFELPESDEYDITVRILKMAGVEIDKDEVVAFAKTEEIQKKQEEQI